MSLIELLVVIGIIGILIGLLLPGIIAMMHRARGAQCLNNLKQLSLATTNYESAMGCLPSGHMMAPNNYGTPWMYKYSAMAVLTPYIEQGNALDLTKPLIGISAGTTYVVSPMTLNAAITFKIARCPRDTAPPADPTSSGYHGLTNYVPCFGSGANNGQVARFVGPGFGAFDPVPTDGVFGVGSRTTIAAITDGTSNSAMWSETILGRNDDPSLPLDVKTMYGAGHTGNGTGWSNSFSDAHCLGWANSPANRSTNRGGGWVDGQHQNYVHWYLPNADEVDCRDYQRTWMAARSRDRSGGVNLAMCDGSVRTVRKSISLPTWRAMATIAGGEVITAD